LRSSVRMLNQRGARAQVATKVSYRSGGNRACNARLPSGSMPTR
jgi:hypothetical protein